MWSMRTRSRYLSRAALALIVALPLGAGVVAPEGGPAPIGGVSPAVAAEPLPDLVVTAEPGRGGVFRDTHGREVTLRGFNVSGSTKLYENSLLPFRSRADAALSARAMRDLTGANVIRFLISWEGVQPTPDTVDTGYLARAVEQIKEFTDRGIYVLVDYHQDLYSSHLFNKGSWYTGDGAPKWVVEAGGYPREFCGICILWGQNMQSSEAVRRAMYDFWHNRAIDTSAGRVRVQDAFLRQARATMAYLRQHLTPTQFARIVGFDPFNEPFDGGLDGGTGADWERNYLMPFYQRFRTAMDQAGWAGKPAFVEPLVFWNTAFFEQGGMSTVGTLSTRFVFNSHYYDGPRLTLDPTPATDGTYADDMNRIRDRAVSLTTAPFVSEFGNKLSGSGSDRTPWMIRSMYQGMDAGVAGGRWWNEPTAARNVLSSTLWHWDIYSDRHHELMNGNPKKVQTEGDAWNDEDHSVVKLDAAGAVTPRLDRRVLDRLYPSAVSGKTLAFAYEDLARSGYGGSGTQQAWLTVPSSLPTVKSVVAGRQYGVLVWQSPAGAASGPTELHLPASFAAANTAVVSDVATTYGLTGTGPVAVAAEVGSTTAQRLLLTDPGTPGVLHVALVVNVTGGTPVTAAQLAAARDELIAWRVREFGS